MNVPLSGEDAADGLRDEAAACRRLASRARSTHRDHSRRRPARPDPALALGNFRNSAR